MKIGVLGATGLLGHHCARAVRAAGHELVAIHRNASRVERLAYLNPELRCAELLDQAAMCRALEGLDGVIHCAGSMPRRGAHWQDVVVSAMDQTAHFYAACRSTGVPRILYTGSAIGLPLHPRGMHGHEGLFYEEPPRSRNPYLMCKWALDRQARDQARGGLPVVIGVPGLCLGEYDFVPSTGSLITRIAHGELTRYVPGRRNLLDAGDAGRGLLAALLRGRLGERYLLCGWNIEMDDLVARIASRLGVDAPRPVSLIQARLLNAAQQVLRPFGGRRPQLSRTDLALMAGGQFLDGRKAREELGFEATRDVDTILERSIGWFREQGYF